MKIKLCVSYFVVGYTSTCPYSWVVDVQHLIWKDQIAKMADLKPRLIQKFDNS